MIQTHDDHQKGSALVYILIAIALLGSLTASLLNTSNSQTTSQRTAEVVSAMKSQIDMIRSAVTECVYTYPQGDNALANNPALSANPGGVPIYPLVPNDPYLASPTTGSSWAKDIRCPGNPGNSNNHVKIFGGTSGKFLPPQVRNFWDWYYDNSADGVFILTATSRSDAFILPAFKKLDEAFGKCEADIVDARGGAKTMSNGGAACGSGLICFRVWLVTRPSALFPDEAGCPAS